MNQKRSKSSDLKGCNWNYWIQSLHHVGHGGIDIYIYIQYKHSTVVLFVMMVIGLC